MSADNVEGGPGAPSDAAGTGETATGHRVRNDDSLHAAVELEHIEEWGADWRAYVGPGTD